MTASTVVTLDKRPDLIDETDRMCSGAWPEFMVHDPVANQFFNRAYDTFPEYQSVLLDEAGKVIACGNAIPVTWDRTVEGLPLEGFDGILRLGISNHERGIAPDTLSAIQAVIAKDYLGKGLSQQVIRAMRERAKEHGLKALIAPVRPNLKHRYPLTPMENYIRWTHTDGTMFDPWLRTHQRLGANLMRVCPYSMTITGTVEDWERWTEMRFPETGRYIIPGALAPVEINYAENSGRYVEANVWMQHDL